jgi:acetoin utilization deacetylase AcuC-like enzyme
VSISAIPELHLHRPLIIHVGDDIVLDESSGGIDTGWCAWCEEVQSPTYLRHEGHDPECPLEDTGEGDGRGYTINLPLPAGATGDVYQAALDDVIAPAAHDFEPSWLLVSCGFDSHRSDPLEGTNLSLSAGDFSDFTRRCMEFAPPGRGVLVLEGGYDLDALAASAGACVAALAGGEYIPQPPTSGGEGRDVVQAVARLRG